MSLLASLLMMAGGLLAVVAGLGLVRLETTFARIHAAGKASPVAFLVAALGATIELGADGAAYLGIGTAAMVLTLPIGVHLLFRATHRNDAGTHLVVDELANVESGPGARPQGVENRPEGP